MSSIMNNISQDTLNKLDQNETIEIISQQQAASSQKKNSKKNKTEKKKCAAGVPFPTKKKVFNILSSDFPMENKDEQKQEIVLVTENGISTAYYKCTKSAGDNCEYCHLHETAFKKYEQDKKNGKTKGSKDLPTRNYFRDVLPRTKDDAERRYLVSSKDSYFDDLGNRGCKQADTGLSITFQTKKHPILLIWNYKDPRYKKELSEFALNLWIKISSEKASHGMEDSDDDNLEEETTNQAPKKRGRPSKKVDEVNNSKATSTQILTNSTQNQNQKVSTTTTNNVEDSDDSDSEEDDENESIIEEEDEIDFGSDSDEEENQKVSTTNNQKMSTSENDLTNVNVEDEDEDDDQVDITNLNGVDCAYFKSNNTVYQADGDEGVLLGFLTEVKDRDHATIKLNGKYYTTTKKFEYKSTEYLHCIENDNVFNMDMTLYGKYIKMNNNSFKINPIKRK